MPPGSFVLEQFEQDTFGELFKVFPFGHYVEVLHCEVDAHPLQLHRLVHVAEIQQLDDVLKIDHRN